MRILHSYLNYITLNPGMSLAKYWEERRKTMKTGVIYARYSSERQNEQSIIGQVEVCKKWANDNHMQPQPNHITHWYLSIVYSVFGVFASGSFGYCLFFRFGSIMDKILGAVGKRSTARTKLHKKRKDRCGSTPWRPLFVLTLRAYNIKRNSVKVVSIHPLQRTQNSDTKDLKMKAFASTVFYHISLRLSSLFTDFLRRCKKCPFSHKAY